MRSHAAPSCPPRPLILVVDDGKLHVTLLRLALMQRGYAVVVVHSAEGARTMVRQKRVDAVLVTLELSVAAEVVRDFGDTRPDVAIVFAPPGDDGVERALAAGFDMALVRPIDFAELDASLRERLKKQVSGTRPRVGAGARHRRRSHEG